MLHVAYILSIIIGRIIPSLAWAGQEERQVATHNRVHQLIRSISAQQTVISGREISLTWAKRNRNDICMTRRDPERQSGELFTVAVSAAGQPPCMIKAFVIARLSPSIIDIPRPSIDRCDRGDTPIGIYDRSFPTSVRVSSSSTFHPSLYYIPFHRTTLARFHFFFTFISFFKLFFRLDIGPESRNGFSLGVTFRLWI